MASTKKANTICLPDLIRHLFLAYLCSALLEYLFLPQQLQNLAGTEGIAQMSMLRLLLITGFLNILASVIVEKHGVLGTLADCFCVFTVERCRIV